MATVLGATVGIEAIGLLLDLKRIAFDAESGDDAVRVFAGKPLNSILSHNCFDNDATVVSASEGGDSVWLRIGTQPIALSLGERRKAA